MSPAPQSTSLSLSPASVGNFFWQLILVIITAITVILGYYATVGGQLHKIHDGVWSFVTPYIMTIVVLYAAYKVIASMICRDKISFTPLGLYGFALLHIMVLCIFFFSSASQTGAGVLFFKIFFFSLLPILLVIVASSLGRRILSYLPGYSAEDGTVRWLLGLGAGLAATSFGLTVLAMAGWYTLPVVSFALLLAGLWSYREVGETCVGIVSHRMTLPWHRATTLVDLVSLRLLTAEFSFVVITFIMGVDMINIVRPMPIGWDDLGVYMNHPQIIANTASLVRGVGMEAWQLFTGMGFFFHSAPQAFFMNQLGGILSVIVIVLTLSYLMRSERPSTVHMPMLFAAVFYSMPMVIFQQAKDMKLDSGLFFISVIAVFLTYVVLMRYRQRTEAEGTSESALNPLSPATLGLMAVIGVIAGFAFTIKVTSLMLFLGIIAVIVYTSLGLGGFVAFFGAFVAVFTAGHLWDYLNVIYPKTDAGLLHAIVLGSALVAIVGLVWALRDRDMQAMRWAVAMVGVFLIGAVVVMAPWLLKNGMELDHMSVGGLITGHPANVQVDLTKIYSQSQIDAIDAADRARALANTNTINEDLGRYFGYEQGINNYLKLPFNLTMQRNQSGEFTDITFVYLALLPVLFVFLLYRRSEWALVIPVLIGVYCWYLYVSEGSATPSVLTQFFAKINLPEGYIAIFGIFLASLLFFRSALRPTDLNKLFILNAVFSTIYVFIYVISSYGIVWYGIVMYFTFMIMMTISVQSMELIGGTGTGDDDTVGTLRLIGGIVVFCLVATFFVRSTLLDHGYNLVSAGEVSFKAGAVDQEEGIFTAHPDYFPILAATNLKDPDSVTKDAMAKADPTLRTIIDSFMAGSSDLTRLMQVLTQIQDQQDANGPDDIQIKARAKTLLHSLYMTVLYPPRELQNDQPIYRIGTFLSYFITNSPYRFYEDNLIFNFSNYYYDTDPDVTVDRMKKVGLRYLLVDLNAATIDKDPRHALTTRYDGLISAFRSKNLELVQTDSLCLRLALDDKAHADRYLTIAGVNYDSYTASGMVVSRYAKQRECHTRILELATSNGIDQTHFPYLMPVVNYVNQAKPKDANEALADIAQAVNMGWMVLFRIK